MISDDNDEQRIIRIARALCRSARINPDAPVDEATRALLPASQRGEVELGSAWMAFRDSARDFAASHPREIVRSL